MGSTRVTLDGIPMLASGDVGWMLIPGTRPHQRVFDLTRANASRLMSRDPQQPKRLRISSSGRDDLVIEGLYALALVPGRFPFTRGVIVTDSRYFWARRWFSADFNRRRKTGETRLTGEGRIENRPIVADVAYAPWSLKPSGSKWTASEVLRYIFDVVEPGRVRIPNPLTRQIEIETFDPNDQGDFALEKVLNYCGGYNVTPLPDGTYEVYDTLDRSEGRMMESAGPIAAWSGNRDRVDRSASRPARVHVLFERETELRFDYTESSLPPLTSVRNFEPPILENVCPCPWPTMKLAEQDGGRTVAQGTIITIDELLNALEASGTRLRGSREPLTKELIRLCYFEPNWTNLTNRFCINPDAGGTTDVRWAAAIRTIRAHFRLTFRPIPAWRDKMRSVRDYRVAVIDPETGTRAPTQAYMDYVWVPSALGIFKRANSASGVSLQILGYPLAGGPLSTGQAAPGFVKIEDPDQALMHVVLKRDPYGTTEGLAPGRIDNAILSSISEARSQGDFARVFGGAASLTASFGCAVVVTAVQACPNNLGRYHEEIVDSVDASHTLGQHVGPSNGRDWFVLIPGTVRPARVAWVDSAADQIKNSFYSGDPIPKSLIVNHEEIVNLARAEGARVYASFLDRTEGSFQVPLNPSLRITGAISHIEHTVSPNGEARSRVSVVPQLQPPPEMAYIPSSIQRGIRQLVQEPT